MNVSCPIDSQQVDQSVVRIMAGIVVSLTLFGMSSQPWFVLSFLSLDFLIRGAGRSAYSPLFVFSRKTSNWLKVTPKLVNAGPKICAAKVGFVVCVAALICVLTGLHIVCTLLCVILIFCAALECLFSVCLGCHLYSFVSRIFCAIKQEGV